MLKRIKIMTMISFLKMKKKAPENSLQKHSTETNKQEAPLLNWCWKGYTAWYLHGMLAPPENQLSIFDSDNKTKGSAKPRSKRREQ